MFKVLITGDAPYGNLTTELFTNTSNISKTSEMSYCMEETDNSTSKFFKLSIVEKD